MGKFGPISFERIYGRDGVHWTPYLTRVKVGRLALHVFHRGDADPDPHDHVAPFWTFPLTTYVEAVFSRPATGTDYIIVDTYPEINIVRRFRWHRRPARYTHLVMGRWGGEDPKDSDRRRWALHRPGMIVTLVWWGHKERAWGFWPRCSDGIRRMVDWKKYIYGDGSKC